jgi:death-on-curing protein
MELIYADIRRAIHIHDKILELSGGRPGMKSQGELESVLHHISNDDYYPEFEDKLTHLVFAVNKGHCFNDGNKRTSIGLGAFFLLANGLDGFVDKFIIEMENVAVAVADNIIDKELLREIIGSLLSEPEYSESLKLKIIERLASAQPSDDPADPPNHGPAFYTDLL